MHTVQLLEEAIRLAQQAGYSIRQEWLGGRGGGGCEIRGRKWLFVDLALEPGEQLGQVLDALRRDPAVAGLSAPEPLRAWLAPRKIA